LEAINSELVETYKQLNDVSQAFSYSGPPSKKKKCGRPPKKKQPNDLIKIKEELEKKAVKLQGQSSGRVAPPQECIRTPPYNPMMLYPHMTPILPHLPMEYVMV